MKAAAVSGQLCKSCVCLSLLFNEVVSIKNLIEGTAGTRQDWKQWEPGKTGNGYRDHAMTRILKIQNSLFPFSNFIYKNHFMHNHLKKQR